VSNSKRYQQLASRLAKLRKHFLPKFFSPIGSYTEKQHDFARGYRLLAHAEFESFLEDIVWNAILIKVESWKNHGKPSALIICFLSCYHSDWGSEIDEESIIVQSPKNHIKATEKSHEAVINRAINQFRLVIDKNHGIRESNIRKITTPVGIKLAELDQTWLNTVDTFGKLRGEVAHKAVGIQQRIDPQTEYQNVVDLLVGFKKLDELVRSAQK